MPHYFTVEEANAALVVIKPLMAEMQRIREHIIAQQPEVWPVVQKAAGNGGSKSASLLVLDFERFDKLVHQIMDMGVILKDLNTGLLDFPAWQDDHEIYLCWKHGEENVSFWHEINAGFAGRQPLE